MVACVEEVCKIWIWLFRNCQGRRIQRQFCRANDPRKDLLLPALLPPGSGKGAVRARQKTVTANLNSRDLMYRLGPAPESGTRPI